MLLAKSGFDHVAGVLAYRNLVAEIATCCYFLEWNESSRELELRVLGDCDGDSIDDNLSTSVVVRRVRSSTEKALVRTLKQN